MPCKNIEDDIGQEGKGIISQEYVADHKIEMSVLFL